MTAAVAPARPVGALLRDWRERRRLSQLDLSIQAEVSTRHLSFVETGRARPTADMILRLTEQLEVPLRERNQLLLAGGYAPAYPQHGLEAPELDRVRQAMRLVLAGHEPFPALAMDRWWNLVEANSAVDVLIGDCAEQLLTPPVNVLRLSLHPDGLAPRIANLGQWRAHLLGQLRRRTERTGDAKLAELRAELESYPGGEDASMPHWNVVLPLRLRHERGELSMFTLSAVIETASDVTVDELVIESFYPSDDRTAASLRAMSRRQTNGQADNPG